MFSTPLRKLDHVWYVRTLGIFESGEYSIVKRIYRELEAQHMKYIRWRKLISHYLLVTFSIWTWCTSRVTPSCTVQVAKCSRGGAGLQRQRSVSCAGGSSPLDLTSGGGGQGITLWTTECHTVLSSHATVSWDDVTTVEISYAPSLLRELCSPIGVSLKVLTT